MANLSRSNCSSSRARLQQSMPASTFATQLQQHTLGAIGLALQQGVYELKGVKWFCWVMFSCSASSSGLWQA